MTGRPEDHAFLGDEEEELPIQVSPIIGWRPLPRTMDQCMPGLPGLTQALALAAESLVRNAREGGMHRILPHFARAAQRVLEDAPH